jgi:hemerythrin
MARLDHSLVTGNELVDEQHREVFELVDEVSHVDGADYAQLIAIIDKLASLAPTHFITEEKLMSETDYPSTPMAAHVAEHRILMEKANRISIDYRRGWTGGTDTLVSYLDEWITHHIVSKDREFVEFLRSTSESTDPRP